MYRVNPKRTGIYNSQGIRNLNGIKWRVKIDPKFNITPPNFGFNCPLVVADGVVYFGDDKGYLYAIDSQGGTVIWKIPIDDRILDNLIIHNRTIYVNSSGGNLFAINLDTQQIKWKSPINFIRHQNPLVSEELIFVNSRDGYLYALDLENGREKWKFKTTKDMAVTPPAFKNGTVYIGSENGYVYAINAESGQEKWNCEVGQLRQRFSVPVVANNVVYIGISNSIIYAIDVESGTKIWQFQVEETYYFSPLCPLIIDENFIYVGVGIGSLCAINIENQQKLWQKQGRAIQRINSISLADGIIYCERSGAINAIEAASGKDLWKFTAPEPDWWILKPNLWLFLLFNSFSQKMTGSSLIQFSSPVIDNGVIYVFCSNGYLYALH